MKCSRCRKEHTSEQFRVCTKCRDKQKIYRDSIPRKYKQGQNSTIDGLNKTCSDCLKCKPLNLFYVHKRYKDGYRNQCIECHSLRWKHYYKNGYAEVLKDKLSSDDVYKLKQNQRSYIHQHMKQQGLTKSKSTCNFINCPILQLKDWINFQLNHTTLDDNDPIQLDHIIPLSLFDLTDENQRRVAFNWTNIQPLKKSDNLKKYNNFRPHEYFNSVINACRFIRYKKLESFEYHNINRSLQWLKTKYTLRHFQIAGNSLES